MRKEATRRHLNFRAAFNSVPVANLDTVYIDLIDSQEHVSILSWNPRMARGRRDAVASLLLGRWHLVARAPTNTVACCSTPPEPRTVVQQAQLGERHRG